MAEFSLQKYLGDQKTRELTRIAEQPAKQFLEGQATTAFATLNTAAAGVNNALGAANTIANTNYGELINAITQSTMQYVMDDLQDYSKQEIEYVTGLALTLPTYIAKRTTYWTTYYTTIEAKNVISELTEDQESKIEKETEKAEKKTQDEKIRNFKTKTAEINNQINAITTNVYSYITAVTKYVTNGPDWIEKNLKKTITKTLDPAKAQMHDSITQGYNELLKFFDDKASTTGQAAARKVAEVTKAATEKALTLANKLKATAISFAKSALQLVKQKAMALIGM